MDQALCVCIKEFESNTYKCVLAPPPCSIAGIDMLLGVGHIRHKIYLFLSLFLTLNQKKGNGISPNSSQLNNLLIILSVALPSKPVQQLEPS